MYPTFDSLLVMSHTNEDDHLFMAWGYIPPARHPIYRVVRGTEKLCGYRYVWDTPNITEQWESGDTPNHAFLISDLRWASSIWFYLFAPDGPFGLQIQGPLMHAILPIQWPAWTHHVFLATRTKGVFKTADFTSDNPTWTPDNGTIPEAHYTSIFQACADPLNPWQRRFVIAGGHVYFLYNWSLDEPALSLLVLSNDEACTLTGSASGTIRWVAGNANRPGWFYVLFNSALTTNGTWCLRTFNYGQTWEAYQIYGGIANNYAGNIVAGIAQGDSPYEAGFVLYCALNTELMARTTLWMSSNNGFSWALMDWKGRTLYNPRCEVDPYDQATVYVGAFEGAINFSELYRSEEHGANLVEVDGLEHLGIFVDWFKGDIAINPLRRAHIKILTRNHIYTTSTFGAVWASPGPTESRVARLKAYEGWPNNLYLARDTDGWILHDPWNFHTIFTTENDGIDMIGKSGSHPDQDDGGGDSIPWNCGGAAHTGIIPIHA